MFRKLMFLFLLLCEFATEYSQTKSVDSLKRNISTAGTSSLKLKFIFALCEQWQSLPADTLQSYLQQAESIAKQIGITSYEKNQLHYSTACFYMKTGKTDTVIRMVDAYVKKLETDSASNRLRMRSYFLKGNALIRGGRYKESLDQFYIVLQMAVAADDNFLTVMANNSIGWAYMDMEQHTIAISWFRQAIAATKDTMLLEKYSFVYANIAASYNNIGRYDSAEYFITKALRGVRKNQNLTAMANVLNIIADVYINTNRKELAGKSLEEAVQIRRQIGDTFYLVSDMAQMAVYYANNNQAGKGVLTANEGIEMATRAGLTAKLLSLYQALAVSYKNSGNFAMYSKTMDKVLTLKDSTYKENVVDAMAEIKAKSDLKIREDELVQQQFAVNKKNMQLYGSVIILALCITVFYLLFKQSRQREQVKLMQALAQEKRMGEQAVITAEENQRKRIAADLHDNLGVQANAILYGTELLRQEHEENGVLVDNLHDTAKDMLVSLRETLWAMKTADVQAADLWMRIINFSKQMQRYYQAIRISTYGMAPTDFSLNSAKALHAVLIVQEAVNNAARHAMASVITITGIPAGNTWKIEVKDDGKGFDMEEMQKKKDSYGLVNMHARAASADLKMNIDTEVFTGTTVLLEIPS